MGLGSSRIGYGLGACGLLAVLAGCAGRPATGPTTGAEVGSASAPADNAREATAARIYALAERRYAEGDYPAAVVLMQRALLQLPETTAHDQRRHALLMRIGHTQMRAWLSTGDEEFLLDAQAMLERYAAIHTELFGEGEAARAERTDVWALLGEVERRIEEPERMADEDLAAERVAVAAGGRAGGGGEPAPADEPIDDHAGEALTPEIERDVVVKRRRLASLDDPRVVARLRSNFSLGEKGLVLTRGGGGDALHGPRGLVRAGSPPTHADADAVAADQRLARSLGYDVLRAARPALRRCYEDAVARQPRMFADSTVELSVLPDGQLGRARIVAGQLVDAEGDVCLVQQIEHARLVEDVPGHEIRVRLALRFFYQDAHHPDGPRGDGPPPAKPSESKPLGPNREPADLSSMPDIDQFAH